ncbi:MAG TPA: hemerythrin domain-containing protein [Terriglobales bacterium]|nr:hemerythrin domain-containing protein [Terriglobales bacterium]
MAANKESAHASTIILIEHRSLDAIIQGMLYLVGNVRLGAKPNFEVFGAMVYYIDAFPERFHHPKEDVYLFKRLRERHAGAVPLLDRLEADHRNGTEKIRDLEQTLMRYQHGGEPQFAAFEKAVTEYADFQWKHMSVEETEVLPLARQYLTQEDWQEIDAAFSGNNDPLVGTRAGAEYENLFRRILKLAPPPIGVGDAT